MNRTKLTLAVLLIALLGFFSPTSTAQQLTWSPEQVVWSATNLETVYAADLDGDSDIDLAMSASGSGSFFWAKNNGDGSFQPPTPVSPNANGVDIRAIKAADVDGDGHLDLVYVNRNHVRIQLGDGAGGFTLLPITVETLSIAFFSDVETADLDSDGDLEIVVISVSLRFVAFYENLGGGVFGPREVVHSMPSSSQFAHGKIDIADVAGTSAPDILFASPVDGTFGYLRSNAGTYSIGGSPVTYITFFPATILESGVDSGSVTRALDVRAVDIDNDGDLDIVGSANDTTAPLRVFEYDGGFGPGQQISAAGNVFSIDLADLDLDGNLDIVTNGNDEVNAIHGLGGGAFASPVILSTSTSTCSASSQKNSRNVVAGDLSGNGYPDVAAAAYCAATVTVSLNEGHYPGSGGGLNLLTGINDVASATPRIKNAAAGDALSVAIRSQASYVGLPPVLLGDFFSTGSPPVGPAGFLDLHVNVNTVFALFDGNSTSGVFGPTVLHPGGLQLQFTIPPALSGSSLMLQALVGAPGPSNIFFTATNGHEIRVGL